MSLDTRVAALDGLLEEAGLDAVLATKDASIAYLTGFWGLQLERFFGVAVKRGGDGALIAPSLDRDSVGAAPTGLDKTLYSAGVSNGLPELFATLDGAKRIGVEEDHLNFARSKALTEAGLRARPGHRRWSCSCARPRRPRRSRPSGAPARTSSRSPTTSCGPSWSSATARPRPTRASRISLARRGATHSEPHILFGAHAARPARLARRARRSRHGDVICRRHLRAVRRLLGRHDPLRARRLAERLGGPGVGGRARGLRRPRSR